MFLPSNKTIGKQERAFQRCLYNWTSLAIINNRNLIKIFNEWMLAYTARVPGFILLYFAFVHILYLCPFLHGLILVNITPEHGLMLLI